MTEIERENMTRKFNNLPAVVYRDEVERLIKEAVAAEREEILKIIQESNNRLEVSLVGNDFIRGAKQALLIVENKIRARSESE